MTYNPNTSAPVVWGARRIYTSAGAVRTTTYPQAIALAQNTDPREQYELVAQIDGQPWETVPILPVLQQPCPDCATPEAIAHNRERRAEWVKREQAAFEAYVAAHHGENDNGRSWTTSEEYKTIYDEEPLGEGCFCDTCSFRGVVLTEAGRQVLEFARTWLLPTIRC